MNISYKRDDKLEYKRKVIDGLVAYNNTFAGGAFADTANVYVFEDGKLVGGCHTELEWNWIFVEAIFYQSQEVFMKIMNELYKYYKGKAEGILVESYIDERIEDYKAAGFEVLGVFSDKPVGKESHIMASREMNIIPIDCSYEVEVMKEKNESHAKTVNEQVKAYNEKLKIDETKIEIEYNAFDQDKLVGGVYGYLIQDYLYVSILWVDEAYRGNDIATKLMDLIEEEAKEKGYNNSYLGTCTFQAKGFYEKSGYEVSMIIPNCPKGYDDFTMVKKIG